MSVVGDDSLQVLGGGVQSGLGVGAGGVGDLADIGSLDNGRGDRDGLVGGGGAIDTSALTVKNRVDLDTWLSGNGAQSDRSIQSGLKFESHKISMIIETNLRRGGLSAGTALSNDSDDGGLLPGLLGDDLDAIVKNGANWAR